MGIILLFFCSEYRNDLIKQTADTNSFASAADLFKIPGMRPKIRARENCNQSIALRKCDSQTDVLRVTRRGLQLPTFGSGPFHTGNGLASLRHR
jgi:hypothetical protein